MFKRRSDRPALIQAHNASVVFKDGVGLFDLTLNIPSRDNFWIDWTERLRQNDNRALVDRSLPANRGYCFRFGPGPDQISHTDP